MGGRTPVPNEGQARVAHLYARDSVFVQKSSGLPLSAVAILGILLALAVAIRLHGLFHDLPFSYYGDELAFVKRSMSLGAGDLNPHWFNKPAFLMYLLLGCFGACYVVGWAFGAFVSSEAFGAYFLHDMGPFLLIARSVVAAFGMATIYGTFLLAKKAWRSLPAGLCAAAVVACLPAMVAGSQVVKEDVPAAAFIVFSLYAYLYSRDTPRIWPLVLAGGLAGLSMATKYYGVILVPVFLLAEGARLLGAKSTGGKTSTVPKWCARSAVIVISFTAAFFAASPYNFLDPTWFGFMTERLQPFLTGATEVRYEPDRRIAFEIGYGTIPRAVADTIVVLTRPQILGPFLSALVLLGIASNLWKQKTRGTSALILGSVGVFLVCVAMWGPYHTSPRHFIPILPLLACFTYAGAITILNVLRSPANVRNFLVAGLVLAAIMPSLVHSVRSNIDINRPDSREMARDWIAANVSQDDLIVLDDYGPELPDNLASVRRLLAVLKTVDAKSGFTAGESARLNLLEKFPAPNGFNVMRLGHPWWSPEELSDDILRASKEHLRMGNPLISRVPRSLAEYQQMGVDYIITNSMAEKRYFDALGPNERFPSFVRFYNDLRKLEPVQMFDPAEWNGKGPTIYVYRLHEPRPQGR